MRYVALWVAAVTLIGSSIVVSEESLGQAAAREKEKKKGKAGTKVITEADLGRSGAGTYNPSDGDTSAPPTTAAPITSTGSTAAPAGPAPKVKTPEEQRAEKEKDWRTRRDKKNEEIARLQAVITRFEGRRIYADPQAQTDLETARKDLAAAKEALSALDDERRQNGFAN